MFVRLHLAATRNAASWTKRRFWCLTGSSYRPHLRKLGWRLHGARSAILEPAALLCISTKNCGVRAQTVAKLAAGSARTNLIYLLLAKNGRIRRRPTRSIFWKKRAQRLSLKSAPSAMCQSSRSTAATGSLAPAEGSCAIIVARILPVLAILISSAKMGPQGITKNVPHLTISTLVAGTL